MRAVHSLTLILLGALGCDRTAGYFPADLAVGGDSDMTVVGLPGYDLSCVGFTVESKLVPVSLAFLLDKSGSMGDGVNGDPLLKWQPVTDALDAFFQDPASKSVKASLTFFPAPSDICNSDAYYTPAVPMRALPELSFGTAMDQVMPGGNTPTLPAVTGMIQYVDDTRASFPAERYAIVLVTDGEPDTCNSSVNNVALELAKVAGVTPTYVIGVGQSLASLDQLAMSGGTDKATLVDVGDANATKAQFLAALDAIRGLVLTCNFAIPPPPMGMMIDFQQVNLTWTPSDTMTPSLVPYDKDCSSGGPGWRYDDPANPKEVQLCAPSCDAARGDRDGKIDVLFGCTTIGNLIS
jgi:hypothetical protein